MLLPSKSPQPGSKLLTFYAKPEYTRCPWIKQRVKYLFTTSKRFLPFFLWQKSIVECNWWKASYSTN
ncbi:hypothetical protein GYH30_056127 [Glycine max]|uniref:Uncharacterized protein n=1 Tax=Glycine max TaxID=3847 RepID=A0A0R0EDJ6_SOYBN|nr:hypothetical protein GYH30_056127 [Glycine max]